MGQSQSFEQHPLSKIEAEQFPEFELLKAPMDQDNPQFIQSFSMDQVSDYVQFFDKYGFVVVRDVLSKEQVQNTVEEIWSEIELTNNDVPRIVKQREYVQKFYESKDGSKVTLPIRSDPKTWQMSQGYPVLANVGLLGGNVCNGKCAMNNRQNENLYQVFCNLYSDAYKTKCGVNEGEMKLWVSFDRYGVMRPTRDIPVPYDFYNVEEATKNAKEILQREEWKGSLSVHWDCNPWKYMQAAVERELNNASAADVATKIAPVDQQLIASQLEDITETPDHYFIGENNDTNSHPIKMQGLVALTDCTERDGGFCIVPGFHKHFLTWAAKTRSFYAEKFTGHFVNVPKEDKLLQQVQKIPIPRGSLLVWDNRMPHANFENDSNKFRMVQYIKMFPAKENEAFNELQEKRRGAIKAMLPANFELTETGKKVFGLQ